LFNAGDFLVRRADARLLGRNNFLLLYCRRALRWLLEGRALFFRQGAALSLQQLPTLHRKHKITPRGEADRHAAPGGTPSIFGRSGPRSPVPFAGSLFVCANAAVARSDIRPGKKNFIEYSQKTWSDAGTRNNIVFTGSKSTL
jgi:hypothetical protein